MRGNVGASGSRQSSAASRQCLGSRPGSDALIRWRKGRDYAYQGTRADSVSISYGLRSVDGSMVRLRCMASRQRAGGADDGPAHVKECSDLPCRRPVKTPLERVSAAKLRREASSPPAAGRRLSMPESSRSTCRTARATSRPRWPGSRPRSRTTTPWACMSTPRRTRGAGGS